ncbi:hypothetical protein EHS25_008808 [Saitozyma podzolica]|uniref:RRM domain-containing protein n=1 Tax=Saitozyma podzolica TaxID=1890683 RepID=A0A427YMT2_9TREE|nr:hypothetical protein EHS25_008808 [Saitozyma podzolica]
MSRRLYVGRLPPTATRSDVEDHFKAHGRIVDVRLMGNFGFIEFESERDGEDAARELNGKEFMGENLIVEPSRDSRRRDNYDGGYDRPPPRGPPRTRGVRINVIGVPQATSWQRMSGQGGRRSTFSSGLRPIPVKITRQRTALKDDGSSLGPWPRIPVASPGFLLAQPGFQPIFILGAGPSEYRAALSARLHGGMLLVDLKDFGRLGSPAVTFADIDRYNPGTGILEFSSMYEAEDAVRKLEGVDINGVQVKLEIVGEGGGGRDSHDRRPPPPRDYGYDRPRYEDRGGYGRDRSPPRRDYGRYDDRRDDRRDYGRERDRSPPRRSYDDRGDRGDRGGRDEDRYSRDDRPPRDDRPARDERDRNGSVRD